MAVVNLTPVLDALGGATATPAVFTATAMRAGRTAVRVNSGTITFPTDLTAEWDGTVWDAPPQLHLLPADCYWRVRVSAARNRIERNVILPDSGDRVDFGDLIPVTPDTGQPDNGALAQYQATQQFVANQVTQVTATAATIFSTVATVQAQIGTATDAASASADAAAAAVAAQAELVADLANIATSTAAAAGSATEAAGYASTAAGSASAAATSAATAASAAVATAADRDAITAAIAAFNASTIDGNN